MKKKVLLVIGIIVFVILAVGSISDSGSKNNVEVETEEKKAEVPKTEEPVKKEYELSGVKMESNDFATYVKGVLTNNGGAKDYVQVLIPCYDKDGAKLGNALGNVNNIEANGKWKFKAIFLGDEKPAKCDIEKVEVSGF
ncbi:MAG: FxLYD domain-containing protein [Fusobacteriales bacterium]|jgi:hypothetical protein|nr:FxLYD domain-containing protein [Fusobacteriales bacterium]